MEIEFFTISSLEKVLCDTRPVLTQSKYTKLRDESFSFQVAYKSDVMIKSARLQIDSDIKDEIKAFMVENVPVVLACYPDCDDYVISDKSGVYPDILREFEPRDIYLRPGKWGAVWITVNSAKVGKHDIQLRLFDQSDNCLAAATYTLEILSAELGKSDLIYTNWMHYDCIAQQYGVPVFSEEYYEILDRYIASAVDHGMNMLFTPLFTPALDTYVGGERPTAQLVDVAVNGGAYTFGFDRLDYFIERAFSLGIKYIEFSHLFTQWGAEFAPKIMAVEDGEYKKIFGWETKSISKEYIDFIDNFLPALISHVALKGWTNRCYYHLSDEPHESHIDMYMQLYRVMKKHLKDNRTIDALSTVDFYLKGTVDIPVVHIDWTKPFRENNIEYWTYYCCSSGNYHANRYIAMPSLRNRILGTQLYLMNVKGFLHWGFNFYYSELSRCRIDPYLVTDAGGAFPAGDAFIVYPGKDGRVVESIRHEVLKEGFQDYRALKALEEKIGRDKVVEFIRAEGVLDFNTYKRDDNWFIGFREKINNLLISE